MAYSLQLSAKSQKIKMRIFSFILLLITCVSLTAQNVELKGRITDAGSGEGLIGAQVKVTDTKGAITDLDGYYVIQLEAGTYDIVCSYPSYVRQSKNVNIQSATEVNFEMKTLNLQEITVIADVAKERETPVAFSSVSVETIEAELGAQDLPMVLNSTPGIYATQSGGGEGDARISIRGFNQRNIAVLVDGLPVNDMENGQVYWSNWSGLSDVTKTMQVQRGLGASKLAIPSIGGTINIITKGIESKKGVTVKQNISAGGVFQTAVSATTGRLDNGWALTTYGSYKWGSGFVDQAFVRAGSYFLRVDKEIGNHLISMSVFGAPQTHGQRTSRRLIGYFDADYARERGVTEEELANAKDWGLRYNENWGNLTTYDLTENGDTINQSTGIKNSRVNHYHKPQITLKDYWNISDGLSWSNIAYMSIGRGGGSSGTWTADAPLNQTDGQVNFQRFYDANRFGLFAIDPNIDPELKKSGDFIRSSNNEHIWYGLLSQVNKKWDNGLNLSVGIDLRDYTGAHYRTPYDLLGGDYVIEVTDNRTIDAANTPRRIGDKIDYHNDSFVRWTGGFGQLEYTNGTFSSFVNATWAYSGHKRIDYFKRKDVVIDGEVFPQAVGFGETFEVDDVSYTVDSPEARYAETDWVWLSGYTFKAGGLYNLNKHHNVFLNGGYYSKVPRFQNVLTFSNDVANPLSNEGVRAIEVGYGIKYPKFAANINAYYTQWLNRPLNRPGSVSDPITEELVYFNISGMEAIHQGIEADFIIKPHKKIDIEGLLSFGDWIWNSADTVEIFNEQQVAIGDTAFSAIGVHVGDAAQFQLGSSIRYEPIKGLFFKARWTYFGKNFSDFDPLALEISGPNANRESWQLPNYSLFDFYTGYRFKWNDLRCSVNVTIHNVLSETYVSDAQNGASFNTATALVYMGLPRRWSTSFKVKF